MPVTIPLEPQARAFAQATSRPPFLADLGPQKGREAVDAVQTTTVPKPPVEREQLIVQGGPSGQVKIDLIKPPGARDQLPVVLYIHGAGWVFGNAHTHDRLVRNLAVGAQTAVVFPHYSLSPEAKYPTALEEIYAVLQWIGEHGPAHGLDPERLSIAGDSVGGNMAAAITLMAKQRKGPRIGKQLLFYPVTDANFETGSYCQFAEGYFLRRDAMMWFWDQYTSNPQQRMEISAAPLRASHEQLSGLPKALVITGQADVLRDEGEAYASKLLEAGVPVTAVRFQGIIHDFLMLDALADTGAAIAAMALATTWLQQ